MKRSILFGIAILAVLWMPVYAKPTLKQIEAVAKSIEWIGGQNCIRIPGDKLMYIDPYKITSDKKADYVLFTHSHADHFSVADYKKVSDENTTFLGPDDCLSKVESANKVFMSPGTSFSADGFDIRTVPAYNIKAQFHPKSMGWLGYVIKINGVTIYITGDTERIPEMKKIKADIIILPLGQTYTFRTVGDAAASAKDVKATIAIPVHYGEYEGTAQDAQKFTELLKGKVKTIIKTPK